jgi:AAA ATPase domain
MLLAASGTSAERRRGFPYASEVLVGRSGLSPVMVGRGAELDRLSRLLADPGTDSGCHIALVAGEAGVGKTRLVRELVGRVPAGGVVLAGQADPGSLGRPFELLLDALDGTEPDDALLETVTDRRRPIEDRIAGGVGLVRQATGERPALLVFEDLH